MKPARSMLYLALVGSSLVIVGCSGQNGSTNTADSSASAGSNAATTASAGSTASVAAAVSAAGSHGNLAATPTTWDPDADDTTLDMDFTPPSYADIPDDDFGDMVRKGRAIFTDTQEHAGKYVGDDLNCVNCHLGAGRVADSAPLWAAWLRYPRYRGKNDKVNSYTDRLQGCFKYSMNGKAPPADGDIIKALSAYSYWMAARAPTGMDVKGFGFPSQGFEPPSKPDYDNGKEVFADHCAICHGDDGQGQQVNGKTVFPPLWGPESYNWGAGMHKVKTAATFIKHNMPLGLGGSLSDKQAWDVAKYIDSHERPQDPRYTGDIDETAKKYHASKWSLYGTRVKGHKLGQGASEDSE